MTATATAIPPPATAVPTAAQALADHGFDGDKLIAYASTIARREMTRSGSTLGNRYEDLVMYLVEVGCRTLVKYNPQKSSATYSASSYVYDVMAKRIPDFYRRKAEGFGDMRKGDSDRVDLTADENVLAHEHQGSLHDAALEVSDNLTPEDRETLELIGIPLAEEGIPLVVLAQRIGIDTATARARLSQLQAALGERIAA